MARPKKDGKGRLGGRSKGTPNKKTKDLMEKAEQLGVDPFEILLRFAAGDWKGLGYKTKDTLESAGMGRIIKVDRISADLRKSAAAAAMPYLYPKRKAIEFKPSEGDGSITINFIEKK